jgi:hypothetical protein
MKTQSFTATRKLLGELLKALKNSDSYFHFISGSGKKGGISEKQDIGNGYIGNPIFPIPLTSSFPICPFPIYP